MESSRRKLPPNPREKSNISILSILSILTFAWTIPLFRKGLSKILELDDIFQPLNCDQSDSLGERLERSWKKQLTKSKKPSLTVAIIATFWKEFGTHSLVCLFNDPVARLAQPLLLGQLLLYFRHDSTMSYNDALLYAGGIFVINGLQTLSSAQYYTLAYHNAMKVRIALCSVVYRKSLRLSQTALNGTSPGKVVNLLSNDVSRFESVGLTMNAMWIAPLISLILTYLLWIEIGYAGLIGMAIIIIIVSIQGCMGKLSSIFRLQAALRTDQRIRFMDEIITGIQVIKMYAWEKPFAHLVASARKHEIKVIRKLSYLRGIHMVFILFTTRMALFCTMLAIALIYGSHEITASKVFAVSTYFYGVSFVFSQSFVRGFAELSENLVCMKRLQSFLELDEKQEKNYSNGENIDKAGGDSIKMSTIQQPNVSICMKSATAIWETSSSTSEYSVANSLETDLSKSLTLQNIDLNLPKGKLIGIIGAVGSGKSSLFQVILHELPLQSGSLNINGSISYASQEPWVFAASVRQNILFGESFDRDRYNKVINCCALPRDFDQFENGDLSIVGEKGTLSGGQKARINLARACYRNADIYLLDDPLSAVDAHVGTHIFDKCIGPHGYLAKKNSTRILVTHQVHFLKEADWIVILNDGKIEVQGKPEDLANSGVDFVQLIGLDEKNQDHNSSRKSTTSASSYSISESGSNTRAMEKLEEDKGLQMEESSKGKIKGSISWKYYSAGAHWSVLFVLASLFVFVQMFTSGADYWVSVWTEQEAMRTIQSSQILTLKSNSSPDILSTELCIYIHGALVTCIFIFGNIRSIGFFEVCMRASQNLYNRMFNGINLTAMRFFDINPSGRILNRFSKDIGTIDEALPKALLDGNQNTLILLGSIVVIAMANPYFLIPLWVLGTIFVSIRMIYLKTSKNIKRIEGIAKSPAFTHLAATLNGLSTVRAYNAENLLKNEFDYHQDTHSACWFMYIATSSAFGFTLDVICWLFISFMLAFYMFLDNGASGETVGLALSQVLSMTGIVQLGARQSAEIENLMMSTERVLEYCQLEPEKQPVEMQEISQIWPAHGKIEFQHVFYRYFKEADSVLRDLSFVIESKEKIGIVGRTGAGKSSLIGAILRLACIDGKILIDEIDTSEVSLQDLRKRVAIIPQDPVLFSGTLRRNLDPFEEYPDAEIWSALEKVELKEVAIGPLGLQSEVLARGANYSVGQRQLLCLARAILRKNRILLMDEATASVDPMTDNMIQRTIREKFAECTVLTVAHRLNTIIDSDRVLVMDAGKAAEFDEPHNLLQNKFGIFHGMVEALGAEEFDRLSLIASEKYSPHLKNK